MKPTAFAAIAALVAVARLASAQPTGSPDPAAGGDAAVRATSEGRALVATMQHNARLALDAFEAARARKRHDEIRCADEALSRADVALRRAREDQGMLEAAVASHTDPAMRAVLERMRQRAAASHEARVLADACSSPEASRPGDRTLVIVRIDPRIAQLDP
jgi:Xaa-Pro aminopeptidase